MFLFKPSLASFLLYLYLSLSFFFCFIIMNRRFYILTLLSAVCCILIFTIYPSFRISRSVIQSKSNTPFFNLFNKKKAFATMEATMVSIYSLNTAFALKPTSKTDIIVLLPESIQFQQEDIQQLERLGAHVIRTTFPTTGLKLNTNTCDHTMLNLWALLDYQKIVYFSPDIVFENDVDQFINIPVGSAIITGNFNIPLFVLEPTPETFELLVHEYRRKPHTTTFTDLLETLIDYRLRLPVRKVS
ncbi:hypothetical protein EDC94DRAFT_218901 [Helicostylum pulchrum]|nr:hypothetical protein EDC94DRAFT_218901 [Helicostylum pulchrum]